ncbi:MAG: phosphoglycolate phosphatase [Gammaproteobacteria bacterium]|nr:phosphoglycolate phosphatase [Gammaproteobacteria bacterium]
MTIPLHTVLFDLDGTLADTAPDLAAALNKVRAEEGLPPLPYETIRTEVSHGSVAITRIGFDINEADVEFERLRKRLLDIYVDNLCVETKLFPGMDVVLEKIEASGMNWGVVTNKPAWLTDPLLDQMGLTQRAACIISGDTTNNRKPHPEPLLLACNQAGSEAHQCLYVGDAVRDIEAGKNAGMQTLIAMFGYIGVNDKPETWGADGMIHTPEEILKWI